MILSLILKGVSPFTCETAFISQQKVSVKSLFSFDYISQFNYYIMDLSRFFVIAVSYPETTVLPTVMLVPEKDSNGFVSVTPKSVESVVDPLSTLTFDDFSLNKLIENGVSYKSLHINSDLRLGFDAEIDAFNSHLEEISETLFNTKK